MISREASYDWKKIVLNLNIISIFVGILLFHGHPASCAGQQYASFCRKHGWPCQYDCYGYAFAGMDFRQIFANKRIYFVTFLRLIAVPLMALVLLNLSHLADLSADGPTLILIVFSPSSRHLLPRLPRCARYTATIRAMPVPSMLLLHWLLL